MKKLTKQFFIIIDQKLNLKKIYNEKYFLQYWIGCFFNY